MNISITNTVDSSIPLIKEVFSMTTSIITKVSNAVMEVFYYGTQPIDKFIYVGAAISSYALIKKKYLTVKEVVNAAVVALIITIASIAFKQHQAS